ncbi:TetR/AcrR family transcriptional regulator [Nocardia inohanensis]|uniref:TetR/AcrR family transcriptional regulator n=1 Tax=Nocardia inohanensis TaxID=209246 RepID=UPI0008372495|nr:TetR/AcrR family transcriptional regulator [Nocardia inohanensis]
MADRKRPDDLARLWRVNTGSGLGRRAELDVDRVVATAVELADRAGLTGATLPKIAAALGVTPMSLYRHVGSKDELVGLMADAAFGPAPDPVEQPWRDALTAWTAAQRAVYEQHPWLAQLPISGPPRGPHAIAWMDAGLRALRPTGLDWAAKIGVITVVGGYVRQAYVMNRQLAESWDAAEVDEAQALRNYVGDLTGLVDSARFPDIAALFDSGLFESIPAQPESAEGDFTFGLNLILEGVAAEVQRAQ